jgi:hypothetical protein
MPLVHVQLYSGGKAFRLYHHTCTLCHEHSMWFNTLTVALTDLVEINNIALFERPVEVV